MKIVLVSPTTSTVLNFRMPLIRKFLGNGWDVSVICGDADRKEEIESASVRFYCIKQNNRGLNPFSMLTYRKRVKRILKREKPDVVFTFMLKPNIFGVSAAKKAGVENIFSMVEGLGDVFINTGLRWKIIRLIVCKLYKKSFRQVKKVFFLNRDDADELISHNIIAEQKIELIHGVGVDLEKFNERPIKNYRTFLMIARMLKTKGIMEYCRAAEIVKKKYPDTVFNYIGSEIDGTVKIKDIQAYIDNGSVNYLGAVQDVRDYLEDCAVFVLPSYREGLGLVNVEAAGIGRPVITCNTIGTKETVIDGYNGMLVDVKDVQSLAEKMMYFLENPDKITEMGRNNRIYAEKKFDQKQINEYVYQVVFSEMKE